MTRHVMLAGASTSTSTPSEQVIEQRKAEKLGTNSDDFELDLPKAPQSLVQRMPAWFE